MVKTHNSKSRVKIEMRRRVLASIEEPVVFEAYSGPGMMREACYQGVPVVGVDTDINSVADYLAPAEMVARCIPLDGFNVFDLDAFAAPWEVAWIVAQRRRAVGTIAIFITDGSMGGSANMQPTFRRRGWSRQMMDAIGVNPDDKPSDAITGRGRADVTTHRLIAAFFRGWTVRSFSTAWGGGSGGTLYAAATLTGG